MNDALLAPYTTEDDKKVVQSIGDLKAPGPDGLHAIFFEKIPVPFWWRNLQEVLFAINSGNISEEWNDTIMVLIPKTKSPGLIT